MSNKAWDLISYRQSQDFNDAENRIPESTTMTDLRERYSELMEKYGLREVGRFVRERTSQVMEMKESDEWLK